MTNIINQYNSRFYGNPSFPYIFTNLWIYELGLPPRCRTFAPIAQGQQNQLRQKHPGHALRLPDFLRALWGKSAGNSEITNEY